ncbi:DUF4291 family protein [Candidatus Woesearchaeota archaeon]|nr:DUF4291 family protein [Candidatus Woesearchaeota archaeon]
MASSIDSREILYRRMSEEEAQLTKSSKGLVKGQVRIARGIFRHSSEPFKWLTSRPDYALGYNPHGSIMDLEYPIAAVISCAPGTLDALRELKGKGEIRKGPRNGYGLPSNIIDWFNKRVIAVETYDLRHEKPALPTTQSGIFYLHRDGTYVFFQAFSPKYINEDRFSDSINVHRMSWLKTSLLWTLWRSDWGRKQGQERIVEVSVQPGYLRDLEDRMVLTKYQHSAENEILGQIDPDRAIIGRFWSSSANYWVNANSTRHFGIRGKTLAHYINEVTSGNLRDITDTVRNVEFTRPEHPTATLYQTLGYAKVHETALR